MTGLKYDIITLIISISISLLLFFIYFPETANGQDEGQLLTNLLAENNSNQARPWIGARYVNVTEEIADVLGIKKSKEPIGVMITEITPGSPAEEAGLLAGNTSGFIEGEEIRSGGDIILRADNTTIRNETALNEIIRKKEVGDILALTIFRGDAIRDIPVNVSSRPGFSFENSSVYNDPDNITFVSYDSFDLEFGIKHPITWQLVEEDPYDTRNGIRILSNYENSTDDIQENLRLWREPLAPRKDLNEFVSTRVNTYISSLNASKIAKDFNATDAAQPVYEVKYNYLDQHIGETTAMERLIVYNDMVYVIRYTAEPSEFDDYLPTIERMIDSFDFAPVKKTDYFDIGIRMKYFENWEPELLDETLEFSPSAEDYATSPSPGKYFEIFVSDPSKSVSQDYNDTIHDYENQVYLDFFKLIKSAPTVLENIDTGRKVTGHNVTYSYADSDRGVVTETDIIAIHDDRLYTISYSSERENYTNYAKTMDKVIKSIEFFSPILGEYEDVGLLLQYPSDLKTDHPNNTSIVFSFPSWLDEPKLVISVSRGENSSYGETSDIKLTTTSHEPVPANKQNFPTYSGDGDIVNTLRVTARLNDTVTYEFTYSAVPDEFDKFYSIVDAIINSTRIIDSVSLSESSNFKTLKSNYTGFTIQYPADQIQGIEEYASGVLSLVLPQQQFPSLQFSITTFPSEGKGIYPTVENDIAFYTQQYPDYKITDSTARDFNGFSRYDLEYVIGGDTKFLDSYILNERENIVYLVRYGGDLDEYYSFLPIIERIISSFKPDEGTQHKIYSGLKVGDAPLGVAVNHLTNVVYVANNLDNTVTAINASTHEIISVIPVADSPSAVAVNEAKNTIYVTHDASHSDSLSVIHGKNNTVIENILLGMKEPIYVAVNPSTDRIYVGDAYSKNVSMIDGATNQLLDSISTNGDEPGYLYPINGIGIAIDQIRNKIYVANPSTNEVTVIEGSHTDRFRDDSISDHIPSHINPFDIAINPYKNFGYILGPSNLSAINFETRAEEVYNNLTGEFNTVGINAFTDTIYANDMNKSIVYAIDGTNKSQIAVIPTDLRPAFVAVDPYADIMYVTNSGSDTVTRINGTTNKAIMAVRFDINDNHKGYDRIFGIKFPFNMTISVTPKSESIYCNGMKISDNQYVQYDYGTIVQCSANSSSYLSPLIDSSWSGVDNTQPIEFNVTQYAAESATLVDFQSLLQAIGPSVSVFVLVIVVFAALIPSLSAKIRKPNGHRTWEPLTVDRGTAKEEEILTKAEIVGVDSGVIAGILFLISLAEGFELAELTQISIITATIIFPFAISAAVAARNHEKFAIRLMIAGFICLMIAVIIISMMRF